MSRRLVAFGAVELALLSTFAWIPSAHRFPTPGLVMFGAAFLVYALAALTVGRGDEATGESHGSRPMVVLWTLAILMRVALLPLAPELSDDFHRYLWDGHVQLSGINPYVHAPGAQELEGIRTAYHSGINNPTVPTIYPPLAQIAFLLIGLAGSSVFAMKALWIMCDLATGWVLGRIARATGRDPLRVLVLYLWAPVLIVEVAWSGHLEPLGLLPLAGAIWAGVSLRRDRRSAAATGGLLAMSALVKFAPAAALPALARRGPGLLPERSGTQLAGVAAFALTALILYAPYAAAGPALFTGLQTYGEHWWFMKGAFGLVEALAGDPFLARRIVGFGVVAVIALTWFARFDLERTLLWVLGAGMILTPTFHPWYVLWMLPMAALRSSPSWIALSGLAFIGYFGLGSYQETGEWLQPALARAALWIPFFTLLAGEALYRRSTGEVVSQRG